MNSTTTLVTRAVADPSTLPARRHVLHQLARATTAAWLAAHGLAQAQPTPAGAREKRVALVIGNGGYRNGPLKNPVPDAKAVADSLKSVGFDVTLKTDANLAEMIEAMRQLAVRASDAAVRLVFFAGHGLQHAGRNYLLPVDADIKGEDDVARRSADVGELIDSLSRVQHGINIVILDACRNNPFSGGEIVTADGRRLKYRGVPSKGLAAIDAPVGTMVAFSTAPGGVALDNAKEEHSLYTKHFIENVRTPGLPIELLFKQVRIGVARDTQRMQVPWESSSLTGEFCFQADGKGTCSVTRLGVLTPPVRDDEPTDSTSWRERLLDVPWHVPREHWYGRLAALVLMALWGTSVWLAKMTEPPTLLHLTVILFHEAGHVIFMPFGEALRVAGGTLGQLLMPLACAVSLARRGDNFGAAMCAAWTSMSLMDASIYAYDAYDPVLPLIGGGTGADSFHDFVFLFERYGQLAHARGWARLMHALGALGVYASLAWGAWLLVLQRRYGADR